VDKPNLTSFEIGYLIGVLVGEGSFGGDGKQPHVSLRMHTDHENLFRWLESKLPGGRLYGPYDHSGRKYFQWMARGEFLRDVLVPLLEAHLTPELDGKAFDRFLAMKRRYRVGSPGPGVGGRDA
jgi:hypothetical protein